MQAKVFTYEVNNVHQGHKQLEHNLNDVTRFLLIKSISLSMKTP